MEENLTAVTEFFLLGFQISQDLRIFLFCLFLVVYCGTICGNLLIITLVSTSKILHTPMYFFISQLSISDIMVITDIVPKILHVLLNNGGTITFIDCITQLYFICASEASECLLLAVMSYDRYVAICNPLRYSTIMTSGHCVILYITCWLAGFSIILIHVIETAKLTFCGPNVIDHLFCDIVPLLELSCSDPFIVQLEIYLLSVPVVFTPTTIIVVSYTYIVRAVLRIPSSTGRQKAFSTCSSHLIVVSIFYWTMFSVYVVPTKYLTISMSKILSLLYTVFTPFINPIIYSLRNKDIRKAVQEVFPKRVIWWPSKFKTNQVAEEWGKANTNQLDINSSRTPIDKALRVSGTSPFSSAYRITLAFAFQFLGSAWEQLEKQKPNLFKIQLPVETSRLYRLQWRLPAQDVIRLMLKRKVTGSYPGSTMKKISQEKRHSLTQLIVNWKHINTKRGEQIKILKELSSLVDGP
ncbi:olfactory receptor 11L1-like [Leptodactylus fuscus]|uniref:olfactory receptor 11L1-like n=1 Tax=Leptodactylus fuscus TaxID=238119 RepID=UPI003F4E8BE1